MVNTAEDYMDYLVEEYPDIDRKTLKKIVVMGMKNIQHLIHNDHDIRIGNKKERRVYHMTIVRPMASIQKIFGRATSNLVRLTKLRKKRDLK